MTTVSHRRGIVLTQFLKGLKMSIYTIKKKSYERNVSVWEKFDLQGQVNPRSQKQQGRKRDGLLCCEI